MVVMQERVINRPDSWPLPSRALSKARAAGQIVYLWSIFLRMIKRGN